MKNHLLLFSIMFSLYFYGQIPGTQNIYELNNNVGIGKSNPATKFDVLGSIQLKGSLDIFSYVWDQSYLNSRIALRSNNIKGAGIFTIGPTKTWFFGTPADDAADSFIISFDNKFEGVNSIAQKQFAKLYINSSGNIGIGTINPDSWKLAVKGKIRAEEVKVETGWSDFVFYKDYKLPTLEEVEKHIEEKGHLKDIPSAKEVENNGIFLGEMNSKLLQKIEELTLYTIAQEKKLKEQKEKLEKEKERTTALEERLIKIEKLLKQK